MRQIIRFLFCILLVFEWMPAESRSNPVPETDSQKISVLLIMDDAFGVSYQIAVQEILSIKQQFENFGWDLTVAGVKDTLIPCAWSKDTFGAKSLKTDLKVSVIKDVTEYDAVVVLPGSSHENLICDQHFLNLIAEADRQGLVIAGWCRGVRVLAAAGVVRDKNIIGHMDYADEYDKAGAHYVRFHKKGVREFFDVTPPIADGNIITTVRSLYYRNQMCDRIRQTVLKNIAEKRHTGKIELDPNPVWTRPSSIYPTGVSWTDFNQDGWIDLAVSNGIDASPQPAEIYFSSRGKLPPHPNWTSEYRLPGGNLFTADMNGDDYPELLVSHLGLSKKGFIPGSHVLFCTLNGKLSQTPDWLSPPANGFSCTGGDFDGDGDMDIAFGQGVNAIKKEDKKFQRTSIFLNNDGCFSSIPDWESDKTYLINDICSIDIDNDGDLDLCISGKGFGISLFYNTNGKLEKSPSWFTDSILGARQMAFGDVDGDGFQELAVAVPAPRFFSDGGKFCLFRNNNGILEKEPSWEGEQYKEPSCVAWADVDGDGDLDLAGGGFGAYFGIFENSNGKLSSEFNFIITGDPKRFIVQQIFWGDYDQDYIVNEVRKIAINGKQKVFYIGHKNLQSITALLVNDKPLELSQYCYDLTEGWISLANAPERNDRVSVIYSYSRDLDLAVTSLYKIDIFNNKVVKSPGIIEKLK